MTHEYLPETLEELTPDWLSTALGYPVRDARAKVLGEGKGFMGDVIRLNLDTPESSQPESVIAKLPKRANRAMGELIGVYEREIMFFRTLGDQLPVRIPHMRYSGFDRDKGSENQEAILRAFDRMPLFLHGLIGAFGMKVAAAKKRRYILLIEDLGAMRAGDQLEGLDERQAGDVLEAIAPMHRHFWRKDALRGHFWLLPLDVDARLRHARFKRSREHFGRAVAPGLTDTLDWLMHHGEQLSRRFVADAPETLAHCDLRLDNVLFDGNKGCAFIDWQLVRRAPATYDVAYFLSGALHADAGEDAVQRILARYHQSLAVDDYSLDALRRDYRRATLVNLANLATAGDGDIDFGNDRGNAMMTAWMERLAARAADIDAERLLND